MAMWEKQENAKKEGTHCKICGCKNAQKEVMLNGRKAAICNNCCWYLNGFFKAGSNCIKMQNDVETSDCFRGHCVPSQAAKEIPWT